MRAIDKLDKFPASEVRKLLGEGRWDGGVENKGDFTKGAGLSENQSTRLLEFLDLFQMAETAMEQHPLSQESIAGVVIDKERAIRGAMLDTLFLNFKDSKQGAEGVFELKEISQLVDAAGYGSDRIRIDPSVVRGLEYYTGPVYEVELLLEAKDDKGRPVRFGSVGGGGRYDGLVSRFMGQPVPATGFSIGVSRLMAALKLIEKSDSKADAKPLGPVLVTVMDHGRIADYQQFVTQLRNADPPIPAELYLGSKNHGLNQQLKYANRRNAPCAVIQGSNEKDDPTGPKVIIKDLALGAELSTGADRQEHLQKQSQAQVTVPENALADEVRKILARR
jgi:histidyl-tRNA synthetase